MIEQDGWVTAYATAPAPPVEYFRRAYASFIRCPSCSDSSPPTCTDKRCWWGPVIRFDDWEYRR